MYGWNRSNHLGQISLEVLPKTHVIHLLAGVVFYSLRRILRRYAKGICVSLVRPRYYYGLLRQKVRVRLGLVGIHLSCCSICKREYHHTGNHCVQILPNLGGYFCR